MKCQCFSKKMLNSLSHKSVDFHTSHKGFTLIELLIVIGILAVLATVTLLVLNPAQMFAEARDAGRISDMDTINKALLYYQGVGGTNLGLTNKVYISIPSSYTNCSDLSLPALGTGYEYACSDQAHYRNADGTGWIPVNFTSTQGTLGALLTSLPVDPVNTVPNGFYYTYISGSWALSATMESQKYLSEKAPSDGGSVSTRFEVGNEIALDSIAGLGSGGAVCGNNTKETGETCDGTDLGGATCASVLSTGYTGTLSCNTGCSSFVTTSCVAPWTCGQDETAGLISYWKFNEGTGTTAGDYYGSNDGTLANGPIWTTGKVGNALSFDGVDDYVSIPDSSSLRPNHITLEMWIKLDSNKTWSKFVSKPYRSGSYNSPWHSYAMGQASDTTAVDFSLAIAGTQYHVNSGDYYLDLGRFYYVVATFNGTDMNLYINGQLVGNNSVSGIIDNNEATPLFIGSGYPGIASEYFNGSIDEFAIYNRALTPPEITTLYNRSAGGSAYCQ